MLGRTTSEAYFHHATNSTCHDLTEARSLTPAMKQVLGLGHQFIIKPKFTTSKAQIDTTFERFLRDASLKCYFAGDDDWAPSASKLYTKSVWQPPFPPIEIDTRLCRFQKAVKSLFVKRKTKSNITKFQNELVESMRKDDTHVKA